MNKGESNKNYILLVDDDFINREVLKNILSDKYNFIEAENGVDGLKMIESNRDLLCAVLLDVDMPFMTGIELLEIISERGITEKIPVFLITANDEYDTMETAYKLGVMDVISKPVIPFVVQRRVQSVLELFRARESLQAKVKGQEKQLKENADTIDNLHRNTIEALASAIEFRDMESGEHTNRIYGITKHILSNTVMGRGFSAEEIENMAIGSIMHDVGKIAISDVILNKPGKLTAEEYEIMKGHTVKGAELLERLSKTQNHPAYVYAVDIARHHHERWDGRGYPDGLSGDEISPWSQVVSIADVYDALVSPRVYKRAFSPDEAVEMIKNGECGIFNPKLLAGFLACEKEIRSWYTESDNETGTASNTPAAAETPSEVLNVMLLIDAVKTAYDMLASVNLTRNSYIMLDYGKFLSHRNHIKGEYTDLINHAANYIPKSHRDLFTDTFDGVNLIEQFAKGIKTHNLQYPEYTDDGQLKTVSSTVIIMEDRRNNDIIAVIMAKYID